jgi:hypothetical protein
VNASAFVAETEDNAVDKVVDEVSKMTVAETEDNAVAKVADEVTKMTQSSAVKNYLSMDTFDQYDFFGLSVAKLLREMPDDKRQLGMRLSEECVRDFMDIVLGKTKGRPYPLLPPSMTVVEALYEPIRQMLDPHPRKEEFDDHDLFGLTIAVRMKMMPDEFKIFVIETIAEILYSFVHSSLAFSLNGMTMTIA